MSSWLVGSNYFVGSSALGIAGGIWTGALLLTGEVLIVLSLYMIVDANYHKVTVILAHQ